jgi:hypothetical protein
MFDAAVQIARIAEHGADRAARVAACEFLHAATLWMIGKPEPHLVCPQGVMDATSFGGLSSEPHDATQWVAGTNAKSAASIDKQEFDSTPTPFHKLMQRLFPVILRLAVSQVRKLRQLCESLLNHFMLLIQRHAEVPA